MFHVVHPNGSSLIYLCFVLVEELGSSAYPEDFQEIEVKEEPMEHDAVSYDLF